VDSIGGKKKNFMKTIIAGRTVEYRVNEETGIFEASFEGEVFKNKTLAGLKAAMGNQMRMKPLNIPVIKIEYSGYMREKLEITKGVCIGKHSGNGNLLVRWPGYDKAEQYHQYRGALLVGDADIKRLKQLYKAKEDANEAYNSFLNKTRFDKQMVDKAFGEETTE
jgi:hypothetical protein